VVLALVDCDTEVVLALVNDPGTDADLLKEIGVHTRAADNVVTARNGGDGVPATADDHLFTSLLDLDDVPYVGPVAMEAFLGYGQGVCSGDPPVEVGPDCTETQLLGWLNDPDTTFDDLKDIGLHTQAANNLVATRNGADGVAGTPDDFVFTTLAEVDDVQQVGPVTMETLLAWGELLCGASAEVLMSPQPYDQSHLVEAAALIDDADHSIDVAMYSFRDALVLDALERAVARGVTIRVVFETASEDRHDPAGTRSAQLEDAGIEVRWVNKIMHHKYAILDGPRDDAPAARTGTLVNSSGNWSYGAATRFDENTVTVRGDERLLLLFQQEFDLLWENSRDFVWNETIPDIEGIEITDEMVAAAPGSDAVFTSDNFRTWVSATHGPTFSRVRGNSVARDRMVELIESAEDSILVASGHMRSRQVAEALIAKRHSHPNVEIRVYLDGQEYVSEWYHGEEESDFEACLAGASSATEREDCLDDGLHFGYQLGESGIDVRYKYYAYRWDYHYADQMHHKYVIIDRRVVASGSYNMSSNAEFDTLENIVIYDAGDYSDLVDDFAENLDEIWETGRAEGYHSALLHEIETGTDDFPIVFTPMALDHAEITVLKDAIRENCPDIDSAEYRNNPAAHRWCER
jgi:phosphatidylserine/phosphatidylglycerophosphate/cardiolipin synthase-like enzyme